MSEWEREIVGLIEGEREIKKDKTGNQKETVIQINEWILQVLRGKKRFMSKTDLNPWNYTKNDCYKKLIVK